MKVYTYLNYGGNCRQAFEFYARHLGGRIALLTTHADQPNADRVPAEWKDAVLPMKEEFFAERFGMLRDRFGTSWMLLYEGAAAARR
jgi:uncharacterized glyoxalase superfamily protein PhnB